MDKISHLVAKHYFSKVKKSSRAGREKKGYVLWLNWGSPKSVLKP